MNVPTHEQTTALAALARSGNLTSAQPDQVAVVLDMIGSALRVAAAAKADDPAYVAGAWQPVEVEFARLLTTTLDERGVRLPAHAGGLAGTNG